MKKSILVIDTPSDCEHCILYLEFDNDKPRCGKTYLPIENGKAKSSCPLKPLPQKKEVKSDYYMQREIATQQNTLIDFDKGWNTCIDEILGEEE